MKTQIATQNISAKHQRKIETQNSNIQDAKQF